MERLDEFSLKHRRLRGDMIEVLKMIHDINKVNIGKHFCTDEDRRTRQHSLCLKSRRHLNSNIGLNFFTRRVINYWNPLTDVIASCKSLSKLKVKLDEFMTAKRGNLKYSYIVIQLIHDSFLLLVLFLYNVR